MSKLCNKCKTHKELSGFNKRTGSKDGYNSQCRSCRKIVQKNYRDSDVGRKKMKIWRNSNCTRGYSQNMRDKYPTKNAARKIASNAIRSGHLVVLPCEVCSSMKKIQAHHRDYARPLDVNWLCPDHHREWHRNNKTINGE